MVTQPLLIAKQMAAHNPFLQSDHLNCAHWWPRKWPCDLHGDASKWDNEHCINPNGWLGCGHRWQKAITMVFMKQCFNSPGTFKIKGRVCVVSNENEIGMGRLFNWDTGLRYVQDSQIIMKGCEEPILYTESWTGSYRYMLAQEYTSAGLKLERKNAHYCIVDVVVGKRKE